MTATITVEIEFMNPENEYDYLLVDIEGDVRVENDGIGAYEYWGSKGYDRGQDYLVCEDIKWDKAEYTDSQNQLIQKYLDDHYEQVQEELINSFEKQ